MLMMTGKLGEAGMKTSIRSFKSLMYRASVLFLMATGTACFPGTADEFERAISECDISALDQFDLTEEERESILSRCNAEQERNTTPSTGVEYDDAGRPMTDDERDYENNDGSEDDRGMVDMSNLEEFSGEWIFVNQTGSYRNADQEHGGVLIAKGHNFSDVTIEVLINPRGQDMSVRPTEMGVVFRAYEVNPGQGEGYFAVVDVEAQELRVGFHYADGTNQILDSIGVPVLADDFQVLRMQAIGNHIHVSFNGTDLQLYDDRSSNGAVGLLVTRGIGEFTDFSAEGSLLDQPDFNHDGSVNSDNDESPYYGDSDGETQTLDSLRTHKGEWFNDGDITGNVESDEDALQITSREFGDVYLRTRMLTQTEDTKMGIIFRANLDESGNSTGYFTGLNAEDNQLVLGYHHGNGENQILATAYVEVNIGEFYNIDVEAYGSHIRVNCNGVSLEIESDISYWGVAGLIAADGLAIFTEFEAIEIMD